MTQLKGCFVLVQVLGWKYT